MPFSSRPQAPLARTTLIKMGVRIAVVIALSTLFSYLHMLHTLRAEALAQLQLHVEERAQREQSIFLLAEDNHALLKKALDERLRALSDEEVGARFERLFIRLPDGTVRSRREGFDGTRMPGVFVPRGVKEDADLRRRILAAYDVLNQYGPALLTRFEDTYITLPEGPLILFWPEHPTYCLDAAPTESIIAMDFFPIALPENNPQRRTAWSPVYLEDGSQQRMVSVSTPLDVKGRFAAVISHDILLKDLLGRTVNEHLPEAYNVLFDDAGKLIAYPGMKEVGAEPPGDPARMEFLRRVIERVKTRRPDERVLELPGTGESLAVARLDGPEWNFVTVLPASAVARPAFDAARIVLVLGVLSLLLELALMYWVLRQQITRPLLDFAQATDRVSQGDFHVELDTSRQDELGQLARAFRLMADRIQRREEDLRQANEGLEQRVEERTRELKAVHQQLVETARRAGMAEIATNVLHNVGNVLNSVQTSAHVARSRMAKMRLEHVGRVANMLDERQGDLATFLTEDERGRHLRPFLNKLGQHLQEERQEIVTLLDDVGRYTEHIGDIVKVQQSYARTPRLHEPVVLAGLVEDALRINSAGLVRHQVKVERQLEALPAVLTDKHKTLMVLVNLISNAKYAMDDVPQQERRLSIRLERTPGNTVRIAIQDNGIGIAPELLSRIFQYGFTTREEGHGFGLHSSALAAQDLEGSLSVHSDGPGRGATFTLELPYRPSTEKA